MSHAGDRGGAWSHDWLPFTYYDYLAPPTLRAIAPELIVPMGSYADCKHEYTFHATTKSSILT